MFISITENSRESKAKGINKNAFDDQLKHDDYKNVLFDKSYMINGMKRISIKDHNKGLHRINKISSSSYNDAKYIIKYGYSRLSNFHKSTC